MEFFSIFLGILLFELGLHQIKASFTIKPLGCKSETCLEMNKPAAFDLLHTVSEKDHDFSVTINSNSICVVPALSVRFRYSSTITMNYHRQINLTFTSVGEQSILVKDLRTSDKLKVDVLVVPERMSTCHGRALEITLGIRKVNPVERLDAAIPSVSERDPKRFKIVRSNNPNCQREPKVTWMVDRFWEYYKASYCIMGQYVTKVNLSAFNGLRSYIPADVTDDAEEFNTPPYFLPCGLLRIRMSLSYPGERISYEKQALIRVIRLHKKDGMEVIKMKPQPYYIMRRAGADFDIDASSSYSVYLTSQSGFTGKVSDHMRYRWKCLGLRLVCRHITNSNAPKIFVPGSETRELKFGVRIVTTLELTILYQYPLETKRFFKKKVKSRKTVIFRPTDVPNFDISCLLNCGEKVRPGLPLMLYAYFEFEPNWDQVQWTACDNGPGCDLTILDKQYVVINRDSSIKGRFEVELTVSSNFQTMFAVSEFEQDDATTRAGRDVQPEKNSVDLQTDLMVFMTDYFKPFEETDHFTYKWMPIIYSYIFPLKEGNVLLTRSYQTNLPYLAIPRLQKREYKIGFQAYSVVGAPLLNAGHYVTHTLTVDPSSDSPHKTLVGYYEELTQTRTYGLTHLLWLVYSAIEFTKYSQKDVHSVTRIIGEDLRHRSFSYQEAYLAVLIIARLTESLIEPLPIETVEILFDVLWRAFDMLEEGEEDDYDKVKQIVQYSLESLCHIMNSFDDYDLMTHKILEAANNLMAIFHEIADYHFNRTWEKRVEIYEDSCFFLLLWKREEPGMNLRFKGKHSLESISIYGSAVEMALNKKIHTSVDRNMNIRLFYSTKELYRGIEHPVQMTLGTTILNFSSKLNHLPLNVANFDAEVHIWYKNLHADQDDAVVSGMLELELDSRGTIISSTCLAYKMPVAFTDRTIQFHCHDREVQLAVVTMYAESEYDFLDIFELPFEEIESNRLFMSSDAVKYKVESTEGYRVLLITAVYKNSKQRKDRTRIINITVDVNYHDTICAFWTAKNWNLQECKPSIESTTEELLCVCKKFGAFSGRIKRRHDLEALLPVTVHLRPTEFLLTFILAVVWLIYLTLMIWSHKIDTVYRYANRTFVSPSPSYSVRSPYQFLICTETSAQPGSGTTSRVGIGLIGSLGATPIIHLRGHKCFKVASENWFLISTPMDLGELAGVVVYVEPVGPSPKWFLKSIHVHSLANSTTMVLTCKSWISPEQPRRFFPVRSIPGFISRWLNYWLWQLATMHILFSVFSSPLGFHVKRVWLASMLMAVTIAAFLISFHGIVGVPVNKFQGYSTTEILPVKDRYSYGVLYSPFLLLIHLILAVCFYNCRSERWRILFPPREVQPPVIRSRKPPPHSSQGTQQSTTSRETEITDVSKERASENESKRSSFLSSASFKLRASGVFAGQRRRPGFHEGNSSAKGSKDDTDTPRDYTEGLDECNGIPDNLALLIAIPYCIGSTLLLSMNSMNSSKTNSLNCFEVVSVMLGCLLLVQEPLIALLMSLILSLRKERIHNSALNRANNVKNAMAFERKLLATAYVRPTVSPHLSQHHTPHSLSLFYLQHKLNKVIKEVEAPPPPLLQQRGMLLVLFIILSLVVINIKTDIKEAYDQTKYLTDCFGVGIHNTPRDRSFQMEDIHNFIWKNLLPGITNISATALAFGNPSPERLFGHIGRIRQIRSMVDYKGCEYAQSLPIKPSCRENNPAEVETRNFTQGWDDFPSDKTEKLEEWQQAFLYRKGEWWDSYSDYLLNYPPGGYEILIPYRKVDAWTSTLKEIITDRRWMDKKTRAILIELTFVNLETALASNMIIAFELRNAGVFQLTDVITFPVVISGVKKFVLKIMTYVWVLLCLFDLVSIALSIIRQPFPSSLTNSQVYLDFVRLSAEVFATVILVLDLQKDEEMFQNALRQWKSDPNPYYVNFGHMCFFTVLSNISCGALLAVLIIQLLLEARDFPRFHIFIKMLSSVFVLTLPPIIMVMAFTYFGTKLFGHLQYGYSTYTLSFVQTLQFFVKPIPVFESLTEKSPFFGPIYIVLIWLLLVLFISNMYIIFLNEAYSAYKTRIKMTHQVKKKKSILDFIKTAVFGSREKEMGGAMIAQFASDEQVKQLDENFINFIHAG